MLTGSQILKARRLIKKTTPWLSRRSGVGYGNIVAAQKAGGMASLDTYAASMIRRVLEAEGVEFCTNANGEPDARLTHRDHDAA